MWTLIIIGVPIWLCLSWSDFTWFQQVHQTVIKQCSLLNREGRGARQIYFLLFEQILRKLRICWQPYFPLRGLGSGPVQQKKKWSKYIVRNKEMKGIMLALQSPTFGFHSLLFQSHLLPKPVRRICYLQPKVVYLLELPSTNTISKKNINITTSGRTERQIFKKGYSFNDNSVPGTDLSPWNTGIKKDKITVFMGLIHSSESIQTIILKYNFR